MGGADAGNAIWGLFRKKPPNPENFPGSFAQGRNVGPLFVKAPHTPAKLSYRFAQVLSEETTYTLVSALVLVGKFFSHLLKRNDILHHVWQDSVSPLDPAYCRKHLGTANLNAFFVSFTFGITSPLLCYHRSKKKNTK